MSLLGDDKYFLVDVKVSSSKIRSKVTILLDSDSGISIDELSTFSRQIDQQLEELMPDSFTLEVSSPGLDTPLRTFRQYRKNLGRNLHVLMQDGTEHCGNLEALDEAGILIRPNEKKNKKTASEPIRLLFELIKQTNVLVSF